MQFGIGEFGGAVNADEQIKPSFFGIDFGDVDMKIADWILGELFLGGFFAFDVGQATDTVSF